MTLFGQPHWSKVSATEDEKTESPVVITVVKEVQNQGSWMSRMGMARLAGAGQLGRV